MGTQQRGVTMFFGTDVGRRLPNENCRADAAPMPTQSEERVACDRGGGQGPPQRLLLARRAKEETRSDSRKKSRARFSHPKERENKKKRDNPSLTTRAA